MNYLAINAGSSSIKIKIFSQNMEVIKYYHFKNHSEDNYTLESDNEKKYITEDDFHNPIKYLSENTDSISDVEFIVHRVVHGGEEFKKPTEITSDSIQKIEKYNKFAPLHNPFALEIIKKIKENYSFKQYAVFDTSFHLTNKKEQFLYGLPYGYYENIGVRRFGFHGISYSYILSNLIENEKANESSKIIICHLGSGSSVCAIQNNQSFDHSFGFTPDENLIMATRSGEVDYDAVQFVKDKLMLTNEDIQKLINKESGLLGISGYTKDMKELLNDYSSNERAKLAVDMYINKIVEFISKFYVALEGCDYLVFTGGIGSGSDIIRKMIVQKLKIINIEIDDSKNDGKQDVESALDITSPNSQTKVSAIPTDEEKEMIKSIDNNY